MEKVFIMRHEHENINDDMEIESNKDTSDKIWNEDDPKDMEHEIKVANVKCGKCEIERAKNECEHCGKYFCSTCEIEVHGKSVLEFMNENNFLDYTCNSVHY
jgi:hypothetical protein